MQKLAILRPGEPATLREHAGLLTTTVLELDTVISEVEAMLREVNGSVVSSVQLSNGAHRHKARPYGDVLAWSRRGGSWKLTLNGNPVALLSRWEKIRVVHGLPQLLHQMDADYRVAIDEVRAAVQSVNEFAKSLRETA